MWWMVSAIAGSALYGGSNVVDRFLVEKKISATAVLTAFAALGTLIIGLVVLAVIGFPVFAPGLMVLIVAAGIVFELAQVPYYYALAHDDASRVVPLFQFIPVIVLALSTTLLGETLTASQFIGFWLIVGGAVVISVERWDPRIFRLRRSFWFMLLSSFMFAVPFVVFKHVVIQQNFWTTLGYELLGGGLALFILLLNRTTARGFVAACRTMSGTTAGSLALSQAFYFFGRLLSFFAISLAPVSLVVVLGGFQPFFVLIYGLMISIWFPKIIKEDLRPAVVLLKFLATIIIVVGLWYIGHEA